MLLAIPRVRLTTRLTIPAVATNAARIGFVLLFPGYFAYHYAISGGWIPAFAGGLFGVSTLGLAGVTVALAPWIVTQVRGGIGIAAAIGALFVVVAVWSTAQLLLAPDYGPVRAGWTEAATTLVGWTAVLFVGRFFPLDDDDAAGRARWWMAVVTICVVHAVLSTGSVLGGFLAFSQFEGGAGQSSYQGIGRSILVTSVIALASFRRDGARLAVLCIGILLLASIGSRSELAALVALFGLVGIVMVIAQRRIALLAGLLLLVSALAVILAPVIEQSRLGELLDLASSTSWQARQELTNLAVERLTASPVLGDFEYYQRDIGAGGYSHNILSVWTNYTVLGFALYASVTLACLLSAVRRVVDWRRASPAWVAAFALNVVAVVLSVSAIPVSHVLPALGWGVTLRAFAGEAPADGAGD